LPLYTGGLLGLAIVLVITSRKFKSFYIFINTIILNLTSKTKTIRL